MSANAKPEGLIVAKAHSVEGTLACAMSLGSVLSAGDVVLLRGPLGAGKTQFAKGVVAGLGSDADVVSPTFALMLEYDDGRVPLMHMDLYRLDDASELEDIDFYGVADESSGYACLIEWAELFPDEMPEDALEVIIERADDEGPQARSIRAIPSGPRSEELLRLWMGVREDQGEA